MLYYYSALRNRKKKKKKDKKTCIWAHTHFLNSAIGKPIKSDLFIAQGDLRHRVITTWHDKQALADSIFICAVNFQGTFLMILGFE